MKRLALRSIRTKLLAAFAILAIGPLALYGFLATREGASQLERRSGELLAGAAADAADAIGAYLHERLGDVAVFSANPVAATGSAEDLAVLTDRYAATFTEYDVIMVADPDGKVIATNSLTGDKKPVDRAGLLGRSVRGQPWFEQVLGGKLAPGDAYLSNAELDPVLAQLTHGPGQGLTVSAGIFDASGKLLRVWSNHISWGRSVGAVLEAQLAGLKRNGIHTAGLELIDKQGVVIDDEDDANNFKVNLLSLKAPWAVRVAAGEQAYARGTDPMDGTEDVVGFSPARDHGGFKANGWGVLVHQEQHEIAAATSSLRNFTLIAVGGAILFVVLGAFLVARALSRPMIASVATLQKVAEGDLTARAPVSGEDEVAQMGTALNHALDRISGAFGAIGDGVIALARSSEELANIGHTLNLSADETSRQAGVVAAASEQAGKNVATVASGTEEMSVTIKEIAKNAAEAARVANSAVGSAQRTNELVSKLGESSNEIGNVLKVITSIAEQTNLLALNATIEAARAGEAGKGFAVVANEVKELAKETARATEDITRKIEAIQADTASAVTAIAEITHIIGEINDIQNTIASSVEEQAATTNEIGRNLHELAQASGEIAQNVTSVATAAGSTAECSTQTQAAAGSLTELSRDLDAQMRQFTYDPAGAAEVASSRRAPQITVLPRSTIQSGNPSSTARLPQPAIAVAPRRTKALTNGHFHR